MRHKPPAAACPHIITSQITAKSWSDHSPNFSTGGTDSLGGAAPSPQKYCSICLTITAWSSRRAGLRRYSLSNILQNSVHPFHASWETLSYTFWPSALSKGGSSKPGSSFFSLTQKTLCSAMSFLVVQIPRAIRKEN